MKKLSSFIILFCVSLTIMAQDVIVKKDGSVIQSKVMEINGTEIKYKKWTNVDGPIYTISRSEVLSINYQNGVKDDFTDMISSSLPRYTGERLECTFSTNYNYVFSMNGKQLNQEAIMDILGKDGYDKFLSGSHLIRIGAPFGTAGFVIGAPSLIALFTGYAMGKEKAPMAVTLGWIGLGVAAPCFISYSILSNIGKSKILEVVTEYNRNNNTMVLFSFSPLILRTETLGQNNLGLGLTFSMNF